MGSEEKEVHPVDVLETPAPTKRAETPSPKGILPCQSLVQKWYMSTVVQATVALLIVANFVVSMCKSEMYPRPKTISEDDVGLNIFEAIALFFNIIFTFELVINLYGHWWWQFWGSGWNIFDFFIVSVSLISMIPGMDVIPGVSVLRLFRSFRVFRLFKRLPALKRILMGIGKSLPNVSYAFVILGLIAGIWAIMGADFFRHDFPREYGGFFRALLSQCQIMTFDGWSSTIARPICLHYGMGYIMYFLTYALAAGIVMQQVVVAILLDIYLSSTGDEDADEGKDEAEGLEKVLSSADKAIENALATAEAAGAALPEQAKKSKVDPHSSSSPPSGKAVKYCETPESQASSAHIVVPDEVDPSSPDRACKVNKDASAAAKASAAPCEKADAAAFLDPATGTPLERKSLMAMRLKAGVMQVQAQLELAHAEAKLTADEKGAEGGQVGDPQPSPKSPAELFEERLQRGREEETPSHIPLQEVVFRAEEQIFEQLDRLQDLISPNANKLERMQRRFWKGCNKRMNRLRAWWARNAFSLPYQNKVHSAYNSNMAQVCLACLIGLNFLVSICEKQILPQNPKGSPDRLKEEEVFTFFEIGFNAAFTIELVINLWGHFWFEFWGNPWNVFDFFIVSTSLLSMMPGNNLPGMSVLRLFRAFRVFRLFKRLKELKKIITGVLSSMPGVANAFVLLFIIQGIWSIMGVTFFSETEEFEDFFGNFSKGMLTMIQIMTFDSWSSGIARPVVLHPDYGGWYALFFISYVFMASIIMMNVIVAILLDKYLSATADSPVDGDTELKLNTTSLEIQILNMQEILMAELHRIEDMLANANGHDDPPEFSCTALSSALSL